MIMLKEDYVSFEVAKLLKEKGFDEPCRSYFISDLGDYRRCAVDITSKNCSSEQILMPTHQMAMKWLREVHHIIFVFKPSHFSGDECTYWTYERWCGDNFDGEVLSFKIYEQAVEAALKYSLENLI